MQKRAFAFRLGAEPCAPMHTRITAANLIQMILCHVIIIHHHLYSSLLPEILRSKTCRVTYVLCSVLCCWKISKCTAQNSWRHGLTLLGSPLLFSTSLWGFIVFSWCNMLGSWQSCGVLSAPSRRPSISPNVLRLEFWSFHIVLLHLFSLLSPLPLLSIFSPVLFSSASPSVQVTE